MSREQLVFDEMFRDQTYGPRDGLSPRDWQLECSNHYLSSVMAWESVSPESRVAPHTYTIYSGTGSGKTKTAGLIAGFMLNTKRVEQVVVVCPTRSIRNRTKKEFFRCFGIDLEVFRKRAHRNGVPRMQQGYLLTYSALMSEPGLHRRLCLSANTLVVYDEIHHLGDSNGWGDSALEAFGKARHILALTGTPYRSDNSRIPFVRYEETADNGILRFQGDYTYSLGRAVADGICRKPCFVYHRGEVDIRMGGTEFRVSFEDRKVNQAVAALRLRGAVCYGSKDRKGMLTEALARCKKERRKVIIFLGGDTESEQTPTEDAWNLLPTELQELGVGPDEYEVITGDDAEAQQKIDRFGASKKWVLVSINMVSEGTDIPQLSAAIFLTSITAKQTTVQRIGRVLRLMSEYDQHKDALIFMFEDKNLIDLADEIEKEVEQEISLRRKRSDPTGSGGGGSKDRAEAIGVGDGKMNMVKFHGSEWPVEVFERARQDILRKGLPDTMLNAVLHLEWTKRDEAQR